MDNNRGKTRAAPSCYFIATSLGPAAVPDQFFALANELVKRGHRAIILVDGRHKEAEKKDANPAVYTWPSPRPTRLRDLVFLCRLIRQHRPVALISNFGSTNVMMLAGWLMKVKCRVAWYHTLTEAVDIDSELSGRKIRWLRFRKRLVYDVGTHVVAVSAAARADLQLNYHVPERKCRVFYNALADPLTQSKPSRVEDTAVCVGRLRRTKGQDVLLRAMALLSSSEAPTVEFIGDGPAKPSLLRESRERKLDAHCIFLEPISHEAAISKMAAATISLIPSRSDNCPLVAIESLAVGTPVIASEVGGLVEIIRDGTDGFLVPPNNPAALAHRIKQLSGDSSLRDLMGLNARTRFLEKFELQKNVKAQADWLETISAA